MRETFASDEDRLRFLLARVTGRQHAQAATGEVGRDGASVKMAWDEPFDDADYTVVVSVEDASGDLGNARIVAKDAESITVRLANANHAKVRQGTLHAIAFGS